jgi:hypothetical protein
MATKEITLELDDDVLSALSTSPEEFARELRLAAAIHWYKCAISLDTARNRN